MCVTLLALLVIAKGSCGFFASIGFLNFDDVINCRFSREIVGRLWWLREGILSLSVRLEESKLPIKVLA